MESLVDYFNEHVYSNENISKGLLLREFHEIKLYILMDKKYSSNEEIYEAIFLKGDYPLMLKLINVYLANPTSNSSIERGFSIMG